ncbi:MAG: septum formation protein Maf [Sedimentisphaerales bacterium]|nr:septum formation protein Maf [Sedimentisphaerales bacterium]
MPEYQSTALILASASPRRRELLTGAGYEFEAVCPDIDESSFSAAGIEPVQYAESLALAKAKSIARMYPESLIIGADTIVDSNGMIIGKPDNAEQARQIVQLLFSKPHKVITGLAICRFRDGIEIVTHDSTTVYPKEMTKEQIDEHIKSNSWIDKAGAYAIQENGDEFVERIEGSLTNVMGMPMELLERLLDEFIHNK